MDLVNHLGSGDITGLANKNAFMNAAGVVGFFVAQA